MKKLNFAIAILILTLVMSSFAGGIVGQTNVGLTKIHLTLLELAKQSPNQCCWNLRVLGIAVLDERLGWVEAVLDVDSGCRKLVAHQDDPFADLLRRGAPNGELRRQGAVRPLRATRGTAASQPGLKS